MVMPVALTAAGRRPGDAGDAVLHVDSGDIEAVAGLEGGGDLAGSVIGAGGADVAHALHAVDGFFQRNGDGFLNRVGIGAHIIADHINLGRRQRGIHRNGEIGDADCSRQNDHQRANSGEHWPMNKEINKQDEPLSFRFFPGALLTASAAVSSRQLRVHLGAQGSNRHSVYQELGARNRSPGHPTFKPEVME